MNAYPTISAALLLCAPVFAQIGGETTSSPLASGSRVAAIGDITGDGISEILIGDPFASPSLGFQGMVVVLDGSDRSQLHAFTGGQADDRLGTEVAAAGDVDGDSIPDYMFNAPGFGAFGYDGNGQVQVISGATGLQIHEFVGLFGLWGLGTGIGAAGDLDGDGHGDLFLHAEGPNNRHGALFAYSGVDGSLLYRLDGSDGITDLDEFFLLHDLDGDGIREYALGHPHYAAAGVWESGMVQVHAGADGTMLYRMEGATFGERLGITLCSTQDRDQDGTPDLLLGGDFFDRNEEALRVYSGADGTFLEEIHFEELIHFEEDLAADGDFDGDGHWDIVANYSDHGNETWIWSGATLERLYRTRAFDDNSYAGDVAFVPDLDGDGGDEVLFTNPAEWISSIDHVPFLRTSTYALSEGSGTQVDLSLDFPLLAAGMEYRVLFSTWYMRAHAIQYGVAIPLSLSELLLDSAVGTYPFATHQGLQGTLGGQGEATASFTIAPMPGSGLLGQTLHVAAVAMPAGQLPAYASVMLPLTVFP